MTTVHSSGGREKQAAGDGPAAQRVIRELGGAKLFDGLDEPALAQLAAIARRLEPGPGETVFSQGDRATAFYLLVRGQVKVYKLMRDGRTATLRYVRPGETFAESALTIEHYPAYTETTTPCVIYCFPVPQLRTLMLAHPELTFSVLVRTTQLMTLLNRRVEELLLPVPARLARYLLELCEEQLSPPLGAPRDPGGAALVSGPRICRLPMTKRDLAARLGTVPETLSRGLGGLKRAGVIRLSGNGELVEILDFSALSRIAQF